MAEALQFVAEENYRDAVIAFGRAVKLYRAEGDLENELRARLGAANSLSERGNLEVAARMYADLRAEPTLTGTLRTSVTSNLATCMARGGDIDTAESMWQECLTAYLDLGDFVSAAACLHNAALAVHERGREVRALRLVGRARSLLSKVEEEPGLIAACDATAGLILHGLGERQAAREAQAAALARFEKLGRRIDAGRCHGNLACYALADGDIAAAEREATAAEAAFGSGPRSGTQEALLSLQIAIALERGDIATASQLSHFAVAVAYSSRSQLEIADAEHNLAVLEAKLDEIDSAITHALRAFNVVDEYRCSMRTMRDRHSLTVSRFEPMLLHALELAHRAARPTLAAELIERARIAGIPVGTFDPAAVIGEFTDNPPPAATAGPLAPDLVSPIEWPGLLSLHPAAKRGQPVPTDFAALLDSAAGGGTWWWGNWVQRGRLHWAVREPGGAISSGASDVDARLLELARSLAPVPTEDEARRAKEAASDLSQAETWAHLAATARVLAGPMVGDVARADVVNAVLPALLRADLGEGAPVDFAEAMERLGHQIIPHPLIDAIDCEPFRLLVSLAPGLTWLPLPLIGRDTAHGFRHLVEIADVSLFPPWPVAAELARTTGQAPRRTSVSIADPLGDLRHARRPTAIDAELTLGSGGEPATLERVRAAVTAAELDTLMLYQGHVVLSDPSEPLSSALLLRGEGGPAQLSAFQLQNEAGQWQFPHTVFLDGCESTGLWGSVEWGGLVPALLRSGARQVISTLWPVIDSPTTAAATTDVVAATLQHGNAARAVSAVQRRFLDLWRSAHGVIPPHNFGAHVVTGWL
jgi:tetratricopeptide (TPR) repeat protein